MRITPVSALAQRLFHRFGVLARYVVLRRQLADRNVNLLSLDVSTSNDQRQTPAGTGAGHDRGFGDAGSGGTSPTGRPYDGDAQATEAAPAETTLVLPGGVLVDVLA